MHAEGDLAKKVFSHENQNTQIKSVLKDKAIDFISLGCPLLAFENLLQSLKHIPVGSEIEKRNVGKLQERKESQYI